MVLNLIILVIVKLKDLTLLALTNQLKLNDLAIRRFNELTKKELSSFIASWLPSY
jgi:hypothetical protein